MVSMAVAGTIVPCDGESTEYALSGSSSTMAGQSLGRKSLSGSERLRYAADNLSKRPAGGGWLDVAG
jgi:hypothetical protein